MARMTQGARTPPVEVRDAGDKGIGVFAGAPIRRHQFITRCVGRVVSSAELSPDHSALQIGWDLWLASPGNALDDWINHSCDPNIGFITGEPVFYSLRDIVAGEELTWDYSTSLTERDWRLRCRCGASRCRRVVRPFTRLSAEEQLRLLPVALFYIRHAATRGPVPLAPLVDSHHLGTHTRLATRPSAVSPSWAVLLRRED